MGEKNRSVISSFSYPIDKDNIVLEIEKIAHREGKTKSQLILKLIEEYVKIHGEGNPAYEITKWVVEEDFKATPAFFADVSKWKNYFEKCDSKEMEGIQLKANSISAMAGKLWHIRKQQEREKLRNG